MKKYVVSQLNKMLELDRNLTEKIVDNRYRVTEKYVKDPDFTCMANKDGTSEAGLIGVINGILPVDEFRVASSYDDDGKLIGFVLINKETNKTI